MDESLKKEIEECIADLEKNQWTGYDGAAYAAGYLHCYPELRKLMLMIAGMNSVLDE